MSEAEEVDVGKTVENGSTETEEATENGSEEKDDEEEEESSINGDSTGNNYLYIHCDTHACNF